jgi:hypothetical protein
MQNDLKTTQNQCQESLVFKLRNQFQKITLSQVTKSVLQTNISAAC